MRRFSPKTWIFFFDPTPSEPPGVGCSLILGIPLVMGLLYLLASGDAKVADTAMKAAIALNVGVVLWIMVQLLRGQLRFAWDGKRFLRGLGIGFVVYVVITAVLILMGLFANLGTGHPISDPVSDKMELSAMLMGASFLWYGFVTK